MDYHQLVAACARAVNADPTTAKTLHDSVGLLSAHAPTNRAYVSEVMVRFMAEFIEAQQPPRTTRH